MRPTRPSRLPSYPAQRLSLILNMHDHAPHGPLMFKLMQRARRAKLSGATAFEGIRGFGESGRIHRTHLISDDAPVTIVIIDTSERIEEFLLDVVDLLDGVLMTLDDLDIVATAKPLRVSPPR